MSDPPVTLDRAYATLLSLAKDFGAVASDTVSGVAGGIASDAQPVAAQGSLETLTPTGDFAQTPTSPDA